MRSGALVDNELKIDFGPDTVAQMQRSGRNLSQVKTILFTHQHSDHVVPSELEWSILPFTQTPPGKIEIIGNRQTIELIERQFERTPRMREGYDLRTVAAGDRFTTVRGYEVQAFPADHVEGAMLHRIQRNGKTLFYGHDSGLYPSATIEALCDGTVLDIIILDCNYGGSESKNRGHMGVDGVIQMVNLLRSRGAIRAHTRVIATHFSHNGGLLHEELVRAPAAWDRGGVRRNGG